MPLSNTSRTCAGLAVIHLAAAARLLACSCSSPLPCEAAARADAIFIGRALKLEKEYVQFSVQEAFKGVAATEIAVFNAGMCAATLKPGIVYLVYAGRTIASPRHHVAELAPSRPPSRI